MENFKDIKGFEGLYQVSDFGKVYSFVSKREIGQSKDSYGYMVVALYKQRKRKTFKIHRLVADAFIDNPNQYTQVNHIDEDKCNNTVSNLEWCNSHYNANYGNRNEIISNSQKNRKDHSKEVLQYDENMCLLNEYPSAHEAERCTGVYRTNISACCRGNSKYPKAGGFIWRYK